MRLAKIKKGYLVAAAALGVGAMICLPRFASASAQGACSDCHTMHNSQGGLPMNFNGATTPNNTLLRGNCIQCHTGTNNGSNTIPYVMDTATPTYGLTGDTLAGGNFYWTVNGAGGAGGGDPVLQFGGHNVDMLGTTPGIALAPGPLTTPPGDSDGTAWSVRVANQTDKWSGASLTCAGTAGCHGDRTQTDNFSAVKGAHHANDSIIDGNTVGTSFRFLLGVVGTEENGTGHGWEYQPSASLHNEYKGVDRGSDATVDSSTISSLCAQCHGAFHNTTGTFSGGVAGISSGGTMDSPWVRHPTDFDMGTVSGADYTAAILGTYKPNVPVGRVTLPVLGSDTTIGSGSGNVAIVMCISCHRAHGSPYADLLRWDYSTMKAGAGTGNTDGCFTCHTTKN